MDLIFGRMLKQYREFRKAHGDLKPTYYRGKEKWSELPAAYR